MPEVAWASPLFLLTLTAIPLLAAALLYAALQRRYAWTQLGSATHLRRSLLVRTTMRRVGAISVFAAFLLIAVACARPQWGHDSSSPRRAGRDVVLVLDLSRSMQAEQPSRHERAGRALMHLAQVFEAHGGNRIALVLFAARAELLFPLTQDYEHLRQAVARIQAQDHPSLRDANAPSGTRIGAALRLAVETGEPHRAGRPSIVLISDGDDPADDADEEWRGGAELARTRRIRVHTVGIGDPEETHTIPIGKDVLLYQGKPVRTRLNEERLRAIAARTSGEYLPAHTQDFRLGTYLRLLLEADHSGDADPADSLLPTLRERYAWFLWPAIVLLMLTMWLPEGPAMQAKTSSSKARLRAPAIAAFLLAILTLTGASSAVDDRLRQADEAFAQRQYALAVQLYEQVEERTVDPGLIAFNKAAALYQLKRYREAIESYRRCLDDDRAPPTRRAHAWFNLGNALLQHADDDASVLAQSAGAYRACLAQPNLESKLHEDARHNLQIVQQLWLRARPPKPTPPKQNGSRPQPKQPEDNAVWTPVEPKGRQKVAEDQDAPKQPGDQLTSQGMPQILRDDDQVRALSQADTAATLDQAVRRIAEQRRHQRHPDGPAALTIKDW